ncbi:porphobilinogen deaminase [Mycoblastus sanguinarius]|nr:porphobilinogen deaminase [Mycoblastus sanguinarius]
MTAPPPTIVPLNSLSSSAGPSPKVQTQQTLKIATRSSVLAIAQTTLFTQLLSRHHPSLTTTVLPISTSLGDTNKTDTLHSLASTGKSLWTEDLEAELLEGKVDVIVHSLKDVPTKLPSGCVVVAVGTRDEARDAVVMNSRRVGEGKKGLGDLPQGGVVGTSSVRRAAMVRRTYPHLVIKDVRGNIGTRLRKLDDEELGFDALILAGAGVQRIGLGDRVSSWLGGKEGVLHAVGQGAIGVEWREEDTWVRGLLEGVGSGRVERRVRWECVAERGLLRVLEGGCSVPVGVECVWEDTPQEEAPGRGQGDGQQDAQKQQTGFEQDDALPAGPESKADGATLIMRASVVSVDGKQSVEGTRRKYVSSDAEAEDCGWQMAKELVDKGAGEILKEITLNRDMIRGQDGA